MASRERRPWNIVADGIDHYLIPTAFGFLCVLVFTQVVTNIPVVRHYVDTSSGRFVSVSQDHVPASIHTEVARLQLYLSPDESRPDVTVFLNQKPVGTFIRSSMTIDVHDGDVISAESGKPGLVTVQVSHTNPNLLTPSTGQLISIDEPHQPVTVPVVRFLP